jgi:hypothetical protein
MQILTVNIEYIKGNECIQLSNGVELKFSNETGTFPEPTQKDFDKALEEQYPTIISKIPSKNLREINGVIFKGRYGLHFTIINRKKT